MSNFIVERAALDYLTMTFWEARYYERFLWSVVGDPDPDKCTDTSIMWYRGTRCNWDDGSIFYGVGENQGKKHWLTQTSGAAADRVGFALANEKKPGANVSRLDAQITIPLPDWYKAPAFTQTLRNGLWKGRSRKVTLIDGNGDDTVYIGSRSSDRYIRVYVKEKDWLRFEVEFKGKLAFAAWLRYEKSPLLAPAGILVSEIIKLPEHPIKKAFLEQLRNANAIDVQAKKPVKTPSKTFRWLITQVAPALERLLNDHDVGPAAADVLLSLVENSNVNRVG